MFPDKINTFVDLFGGGFNVGINVNADHIIYNDICKQVVGFLRYLQGSNIEEVLQKIDSYIDKYELTKENKEGYLLFREEYNTGIKDPIKFYTLLCYAFNNQIRFNSKGEYSFLNIPFERFDFSDFTEGDFVYADPPYFNSVATYNENGGWTEEMENKLLETLDTLNDKGVKFALSNNLKYDNPLLDKWKDKYIVHYLKHDYSNCNYQKKDKSADCEVLITNY